MRLFGITSFSVLSVERNQITALVAWEDGCASGIPIKDETQVVKWTTSQSLLAEDALYLAECAFDLGWISSDVVSIDPTKLKDLLGWDKERIRAALSILYSLRAPMLDEGIEGDFFFLHPAALK